MGEKIEWNIDLNVPMYTEDFLKNWAPMTELEQEIIADTGVLWGKICEMVGDGQAREGDLRELIAPIHEIQRAVMSQVAARAYPHLYRPLGGGRVLSKQERIERAQAINEERRLLHESGAEATPEDGAGEAR